MSCERVKCDADEGCAAAAIFFIVIPLMIICTYMLHLRLSEIRDRLPAPAAEKKP